MTTPGTNPTDWQNGLVDLVAAELSFLLPAQGETDRLAEKAGDDRGRFQKGCDMRPDWVDDWPRSAGSHERKIPVSADP
jgi:hypothetical protein